MVDLISKQILNTDLFRVFSPVASSLNIGAGLPCQLSDFPAVGEKVIFDDDCAIAIPDGDVLGEAYPLPTMLGDAMLRNYIYGWLRHDSSYRITGIDGGVWSPRIEELRSSLRSMNGEHAWSEDLSHRMGYCGGIQPSLHNLRHAGVYSCGLWRMADQEVLGIMQKLRETPPPVRVSIPRQGSSYGSSLLYTTQAEDGAEILMGWRTHGHYERMCAERAAIANGVLPATTGITGVAAHADHWYGVGQFAPLGATGGVAGVRIDPSGPSLCVDDWARTNSGLLWGIVREKLQSVGVDRLFTEGTIMHARAKAPCDRIRDQGLSGWGTNVIASPMHTLVRGPRYHPIETGAFLVHHVKIVDESPQIFPIALGSPSVFVALRGKMVVESPRGLRVNLKPNQAALVPAMRHGEYYTQAREGSAEFFVVQGVPSKIDRMIASGMLVV